jgi:predicted O-methyltransferase YrrM
MVAERPKINLNYHSFKEAIRVSRKDPLALYDYVFNGLEASVVNQSDRLMQKIGFDTWDLYNYWDAIKKNVQFNECLNACGVRNGNYGQVVAPELLYVIVRKLCPELVIETGVSAGISTSYILQALYDNNFGYLISIDYQNYALSEAQTVITTGFAVPWYLKGRWSLRKGKSEEVLKPLIKEYDKIDLFLHDSEHSYRNMFFEYCAVWDKLRNGGLLISHDINDNKAFYDFAKLENRRYHEVFFTGMGIIRK